MNVKNAAHPAYSRVKDTIIASRQLAIVVERWIDRPRLPGRHVTFGDSLYQSPTA
jgi:hypothetical protein